MSIRLKQLVIGLFVVILVGIVSRIFHSGVPLLDKYLGDALYAVMFYLILSIFWPGGHPIYKAGIVMAGMILIELFQLTLIPLQMRQSTQPVLRIISILLGTEFSWLDMAAYLIGISGVLLLDVFFFAKNQKRSSR